MTVLQSGDRLVVSELSRLGRSLGQIVAILDALAKEGVSFLAIKENIRVEGKQDEIRRFFKLGVSKSAIAKITGVSRPTLYNFIDTRGLSLGPQSAFLHKSGQYPKLGDDASDPAYILTEPRVGYRMPGPGDD